MCVEGLKGRVFVLRAWRDVCVEVFKRESVLLDHSGRHHGAEESAAGAQPVCSAHPYTG